MGAVILATDKDVELVSRTVATDLLPSELNHFIYMCRHWRLDPLRRQIYAMVFNRNKKVKENGEERWEKVRQVTYVTGIDGYRTIADRTGCYRPGERTVERDPELKSASNPQGIVSATAVVWKYAKDEWHKFEETVDWEEFAPLKEIWKNGKPSGEFTLDTSGQWGRMGATMLKKCAEAQALRRGWPDEFGDLYVAEEMAQRQNEMIDITPDQQVNRAESERLKAKLGGPSLTVDWVDGEALQPVPIGKFHDAVKAFIRQHCEQDPDRIALFANRNIHAIREFYAHDKDAALSVKKGLEIFQAQQLERTS